MRKSFGSVAAVCGVSVSVQQNEFVTLLGPSGCGKTTLLRLIAGLELADSGSIEVDGRQVESTAVHLRRTRMVFQQFALFPHMSVQDNVEFGLRMRKVAKAERRSRARLALDMVQLSEKAHSMPSQLSGGQQQRVALARAIVTEPQVLLLDEPLASLDLQLRKSMQLELKSLQQRLGITFIFVTHDQSEALAMSDRIVVMHQGLVEQVGTGQDIYDHPTTSFVARFIGEANIFEGTVIEKRQDELVVDTGAGTLRLPMPEHVVALGQSVSFMVRPERMHVVTADANTRPALTGTIVQRLYLGTITRLVIELPRSGRLFVDVSDSVQGHPGEQLQIGWSPAAVQWIRGSFSVPEKAVPA